ncbi:hypothetical protein JCM11251_006197 [Rhodosporidiobolus azoricus]
MAAPIVLTSQQGGIQGLMRALSRASNAAPTPARTMQWPLDGPPLAPTELGLARQTPRRYPQHDVDDSSSSSSDSSSDGDDDSGRRPARSRRGSLALSLRMEHTEGPAGCNCGCCPSCRAHRRRARKHRHRKNKHKGMLPEESGVNPSPQYLRRAAVPSQPVPADHPLVVISLDGVVDARLPDHLSGGHTDTLSRPYLVPFMEYLLHQHSPWSIVFYSSLSRKKALKTLKELKLPTGGPEKDERDGVVGLFARDDMRSGWDGGELEIKDLDWMWAQLAKEEGVLWTQEDTVILSDRKDFWRKHPSNVLLVPILEYKSTTRPRDDQFLLLMIAVLKDLETESNYSNYLKAQGWDKLDIWMSKEDKYENERNAYVVNAVKICCDYRINIVGFTGN